jgi:tetratricopeptide (TPR) repeat protein
MNIDIAEIYNTLREAGYTRNNIKVLYGTGTVSTNTINDGCWWGGDFNYDGNEDISGPAYKNNIDEVFSSLHSLNSEDQLFVYVSAHGTYDVAISKSEFLIPGSPCFYSSADLVNAVHSIGCAEMIFLFQVCFSGNFITALKNDPNSLCKNRIIQTPVDTLNPAMDEWYITGGHCGEFTFYLAAAMRGYYMYDYLNPMKWGCRTGGYPFDEINWGVGQSHPPDYNPDNGDPVSVGYSGVTHGNADGFTQFIEAFNYANCMDSWSHYGYHNECTWAPATSGHDDPQKGIDNGFTYNNGESADDLFCLNGIAGNTSITQEFLGRSYLLGGNLNVHSNTHIQAGATITIGVDDAKIDVDANHTLTVEDGFILKGTGSTTNPDALYIENLSNFLDLKHGIFTSVNLMNYGKLWIEPDPNNLNLRSTFNDCQSIGSVSGEVRVISSDFNNSSLYLGDNPSSFHSATVDGCRFITTIAIDNIAVTHFKNFSITNNYISGGLYGLGLYFDGSTSGNHLVQNNEISNCTAGGIYIYGSEASLDMNHIHDINNSVGPGMGVEILNNSSNVSMTGNQAAQHYFQTQEIRDCSGLELYATNNCLPRFMRYNAIVDADRENGDPLFYYDNRYTGGNPQYDIKLNCWGSCAFFNPEQDLKLNFGVFLPYPLWCIYPEEDPPNPDAVMYETAINYVDSGNYYEAMDLFQLLVESWPHSNYAKASMKAMFETEFYEENDFNGLKIFYLNNDSILADTSLTQLGDFLANKCDVQMHDYSSAISWYENRIQNSTDPNDSVFAIIDLGDLYTHMDTTGNKPIFMGSMPQYKPKSKAQYTAYRDSLIFLLPFTKDPLKKSIARLTNGQLLQNIPNPFSSSTDFYFRLSSAKKAEIRIYDIRGMLRLVIPVTNLSDGTQKITFNTCDLAPGIYEYELTVNDERRGAKKMVVIR